MEKPIRDYDKETLEEDIIYEGIQLNATEAIKNAFFKAQHLLTNEDPMKGHINYRVMIEHLEGLCRASNKLPANYQENLNNFINTKEYIEADKLSKTVKLANKKMELMLTEIWSTSEIRAPLKV